MSARKTPAVSAPEASSPHLAAAPMEAQISGIASG